MTHIIDVRTGDRDGAGTDADVYIKINRETTGKTHKLDNWLENDHERGKTSTFTVKESAQGGRVTEIELWRKKRLLVDDSWYVNVIEVEAVNDGIRTYFPIHRWIQANRRYVFIENDARLPHHWPDEYREQRKAELEEKKKLYNYIQNAPDGPAQIESLPGDEYFSFSHKFEINLDKVKLFTDKMLVSIRTAKNWKSINDLKQIYEYAWQRMQAKPYCLDCWHEDKWFGLQRVQGCNAILIRLCEEIPNKFGVTEEMVSEFLEGLTLVEALQNNRLFIVDLDILKDCTAASRVVCAPIALFFLNKNKDLMPIAIQLFQDKGDNNPVFLPSDPPYTWLLAKMYYNNAEATHHQAYTHLGFTHLIMEGVVICTHRNLSPSHPLFRLLAPHFLYLLAINSRGLQKLVCKDGWVDKTMTVGSKGMFEVIRRGLKLWKLNINANIPKEIESRHVADPAILPHYPYRDDAIAIYNAIRTYVVAIVKEFYPSNEDVQKDEELQNWRKELVAERKTSADGADQRRLSGVGIEGVPGDNGFTNVDQVIETMANIISVCSIGHSAANFQQYDEYAFPPNYPAILLGEIPRDKKALTEEDLLKQLPTKDQTLDIMMITNLLSIKGSNSLGNFEVQYLYNKTAVEATEKFREELKNIGDKIDSKSSGQNTDYIWLHPNKVTNSISI